MDISHVRPGVVNADYTRLNQIITEYGVGMFSSSADIPWFARDGSRNFEAYSVPFNSPDQLEEARMVKMFRDSMINADFEFWHITDGIAVAVESDTSSGGPYRLLTGQRRMAASYQLFDEYYNYEPAVRSAAKDDVVRVTLLRKDLPKADALFIYAYLNTYTWE